MTKLEKEAEEYANNLAFVFETDIVQRIVRERVRLALIDVLEPREKRIAELEARLEREKNLNQCLSDHNEQLRELIEKMKCCYNCKFDNLEPPEVISNGVCENCINHSKWELED